MTGYRDRCKVVTSVKQARPSSGRQVTTMAMLQSTLKQRPTTVVSADVSLHIGTAFEGNYNPSQGRSAEHLCWL